MAEDGSEQALSVLIAARDAALRDVERTMIQIVQVSISMIGFGFTIHAFLNNAGAGATFSIDLDQIARRLGLALVAIGMLNLGWGAFNQLRYQAILQRRHRLPPGVAGRQVYSTRATFVVAFLLLAVGLAALASMTVQAFG
ncbi:DUF202 domain-containing protein [Phenylobacterium sp. 58.2.17]|jgi:uncharacterized membrane protein YidH (DUF202 family)|uniref:DUF202 domain-containing protein n=1 Tax=Phenylobacterium sp. 58.2.17 TaxID=2969306 RepID=UPI002264D1E9|nr:DUF202 domain-containing protein [Phenylobacterium sp. 58.2.17]MCX7588538.1 DUF202 domain-containing protein [Phenylobacterium sp. 58.2.17]